MSTDGEAPLTRAQLRALREQAAQEEAARREPSSPAEGRTPAGDRPDAAPDAAERPSPDQSPPRGPDAAGPVATAGSGSDASDGETPVGAPPAVVGAGLFADRSTDPFDEPVTPAEVPRAAASVAEPERSIPAPTSPISGIGAVPPAPARESAARPVPPRRFRLAVLSVLGVLLLVGVGLTAVNLLQGPRVVNVKVDPAQAIEASGSRVILTTSQPLAAVKASQVKVEPAVPFTVDASGRSVGIRFTVPLDDATKYSVTVSGATPSGGGPKGDLTASFITPKSRMLLLQRSAKEDKIFNTDLSGKGPTLVFSHERISDFRATANAIVVAVDDGKSSRLIVMNRDGSGQRDLKLPGKGFVSTLQVSDRGGLVGYTYSDHDLTDTSGRASVLVTEPLSGKGEPRIVKVGGKEASVGDWRFVPDSSSLLLIDFNSALSLEDPTSDAGVQSLGLAASILGITRGTYTAVVQRTDGPLVEMDLANGEEKALPTTDPDYGPPNTVLPLTDGTLQHVVQRDSEGMPTGQAVIRTDAKGKAQPVIQVKGTDAILQVCASPSGRYAAVVVAPDLPNNPYDDMLLPLPGTLHTHLIELSSGKELVALNGFDSSWCQTAPQM